MSGRKRQASESPQANEAAFEYYLRLARVRAFVLRHYSEAITLADAAEVAEMERTSFSSFFHQKRAFATATG